MRQIYEEWLTHCIEVQKYGCCGEKFDLLESLVAKDSVFWQQLGAFLSGKNVKREGFFSNPEATSIHILARLKQYFNPHISLAHYTNFDVACKIIENEEFWLCPVQGMNDCNELKFGLGCMFDLIKNNDLIRKQLEKCCSVFEQGDKFDYIKYFELSLEEMAQNTYMMCFAEHRSESPHGKLSMWERYAREGVMFVFRKEALDGLQTLFRKNVQAQNKCIPDVKEIDEVFGLANHPQEKHTHNTDFTDNGIFNLLPVMYAGKGKQSLINIFDKTLQNIWDNKDYYKQMYASIPQLYYKDLYYIIFLSVIMMKHPMFIEETEYRMFFSKKDSLRLNFSALEENRDKVKNKEKVIYKVKFGQLFKDSKKYTTGYTWDYFIKKIVVWDSKANPGEEKKQKILDLLNKKGCNFQNVELTDIPLTIDK